MKKTILGTMCFLLFASSQLSAQWQLGGNNLTTSEKIGSNTGFSVIFETKNLERGRITGAGLWGMGVKAPKAKLHINSVTGQTPFHVQVNSSTKLLVHSGGGVAIGVNAFPPVNGLLVNGMVGIGTTTPNVNNKLEVINNSTFGSGIGIYTSGDLYGLQAYATYPDGAGIYSTSPNIGVHGNGSKYGLYGSSNSTGVYGSGRYSGVYGSSTDGHGMDGSSVNGYGGNFLSYNGTALFAKTTNGTYAAIFDGSTYCSGTYQTSDQNLKQDIQEVGNALNILHQLKPKSYQFRDDGKYASLQLPKGIHFGLLAQDVEQVLPNLVKESAHELTTNKLGGAMKANANGNPSPMATELKEPTESMKIKAVNYTELIPIMIKAMQEQQQTINILLDKIAKLEAGSKIGGSNNIDNSDLTGVFLEQNYPNPVKQTTTFKYTIPGNTKAQIFIYDSETGKLVKTLSAPPNGQVQMNTNDLKPGNYVYTLMVGGKLAASKQMVLLPK